MAKEFTVADKLKAVLELQKVDSEIDRIQNLKGELPLIVSDLEDEMAGLNTRVGRLEDEIENIENTITERREAKKKAKANIEKYEEQSNDVKNKREFDAINKEIESAELEILHIDKMIREENGRLNELRESTNEILEKIDQVSQELANKSQELDEIERETNKEEAKLSKESDTLKEQVESRILRAYQNLRKNFKNGLAVVPVERESCGGCYNQIPPQKQVDIGMHKKIVVCEHCGRILVDKELHEEIIGTPVQTSE